MSVDSVLEIRAYQLISQSWIRGKVYARQSLDWQLTIHIDVNNDIFVFRHLKYIHGYLLIWLYNFY